MPSHRLYLHLFLPLSVVHLVSFLRKVWNTKMKRMIALLICIIFPLTSMATAYDLPTQDTTTGNLAEVREFTLSDSIYDIGLYSSVDSSIAMMSLKDFSFAALCDNPDTLQSLSILISREEDSFRKDLMVFWYEYLLEKFISASPLTEDSNYASYTLTLPGGKTISALRYTGTSLPGTHPNASNYPAAVRIGASSYHFNCHSYAWYLHGDVSSHSPQLCFNTSQKFRSSPTCATRVYSPRVGDIVLYVNEYNEVASDIHSAIITSTSAGTSHSQITVKSKWGVYGIYSHKLNDCPYYDDINSDHLVFQTEIRYYRLSHNYIQSGNYYYCKGCGYKNPTMVTGVAFE